MSDVEYLVDANGDVWASVCTCPRHVRTSDQRDNRKGHDAKPIGNVCRAPDLAERLGHRPTRRASEVS